MTDEASSPTKIEGAPLGGDPEKRDADEVTVFLSYAHADEDAFGMMGPFKTLLKHLVYAKSGKKIRAFLDRDSIQWGEYWEDRLDSEILGSSIFIPMLSASYLDSPNCRLEFNQFQSKSTALGVQELLLPVLVLNAPAIFNDSSTDDIVREATARQWELIEDAVLSEPGSAEWKKTMARLADRFVESYQVAESHLARLVSRPPDADVEVEASATDAGDDEEEDDSPGLVDILQTFQEKTDALTRIAAEMGPAIEGLGTAAQTAGPLRDNPTTKDVQIWTLRSASAFKEPAEQISSVGEHLFNATKDLDVDMRELRRLTLNAPPELGLSESYNSIIDQLVGVEDVIQTLESLLDSLRPVEYFSAALRKSLKPARRGVVRVTDSIRLIKTWQKI